MKPFHEFSWELTIQIQTAFAKLGVFPPLNMLLIIKKIISAPFFSKFSTTDMNPCRFWKEFNCNV